MIKLSPLGQTGAVSRRQRGANVFLLALDLRDWLYFARFIGGRFGPTDPRLFTGPAGRSMIAAGSF
jgi:hypothetical protein